MFNPESNLAALLAAPMRPGRLVWIGLRPARREAVEPVEIALAEAGKGLAGDHYKTLRDGKRQVTLMQHEHLVAIASYIGRDALAPEVLRRNLVTRGINLLALKGKHFRIGSVVLEYTGECHPCSRMEESLGLGGYNAVRGHGGITARIVEGGTLSVGDEVLALPEKP